MIVGVKRTLLSLFILSAALPIDLAAQATFSAVVRDASGRPLGDVDVSIPSLGLRTKTDSSGRARIPDVLRGGYSIRARRLGFEPFAGRVQIDTDTPELNIVLKPVTITLDTMRVTGSCPWRGFNGFECRRKKSAGLFHDYIAIDSAQVD